MAKQLSLMLFALPWSLRHTFAETVKKDKKLLFGDKSQHEMQLGQVLHHWFDTCLQPTSIKKA
jgi:hypothetical protein